MKVSKNRVGLGDEATNTVVSEVNCGEVLNKIVSIWEISSRNRLQARFDIGVLLKGTEAAKPDRSQVYGKSLMKKAAKRLKLHPSELSRMRSFAEKFATFAEFQTKHPKVLSWSEVKRSVLPSGKTGKTGRSQARQREMRLGTLVVRLDRLAQHLQGRSFRQDSDEGRQLHTAVQRLLEVAGTALGTQWSEHGTKAKALENDEVRDQGGVATELVSNAA